MTQEEWKEIGAVVENIDREKDPLFIPYWDYRVGELAKKHGRHVLLEAMKECHRRLRRVKP